MKQVNWLVLPVVILSSACAANRVVIPKRVVELNCRGVKVPMLLGPVVNVGGKYTAQKVDTFGSSVYNPYMTFSQSNWGEFVQTERTTYKGKSCSKDIRDELIGVTRGLNNRALSNLEIEAVMELEPRIFTYDLSRIEEISISGNVIKIRR